MRQTGKDGGQERDDIRLGLAIQCFAEGFHTFEARNAFLGVCTFFNARAKLFRFRNAVFALGCVGLSETHVCSGTEAEVEASVLMQDRRREQLRPQ